MWLFWIVFALGMWSLWCHSDFSGMKFFDDGDEPEFMENITINSRVVVRSHWDNEPFHVPNDSDDRDDWYDPMPFVEPLRRDADRLRMSKAYIAKRKEVK